MKELLKDILKRLQLYHPLQASYRAVLFDLKLFYYRRKYAIYKGTGFSCNVCHAQYERFVADAPAEENRFALDRHKVIAGYGKNIFCPNCGSTARERLVIAKLAPVDLFQKTILHLSPEKNIYGFIRKSATVVTADLLPGFYRSVDGLVKKEDATQLTFADNSFDWVIGNHILEHIPNDRKAIAEIFRVLKPGGKAVLQVPYSATLPNTIEEPYIADPKRQSHLFGQKDHVRIYALDDYVQRLSHAGFDVTVIPYEALRQYQEFAIQNDECFFDISKPLIF